MVWYILISEPILIHYFKLKSTLYSHFLSLYLMSCFCPRTPSRVLHCHVTLGSSCLWQFLRLSLFLMTLSWQFWGVLVRHFVECSSAGMCLMFSLWLESGHGFWEKTTEVVLFSWHHTQGTYCQYDLSLLMSTFVTWLR